MKRLPTVARQLGWALLILLAPLSPQAAGQGELRMERFLDGLVTLEADFIQTLFSAEDTLLEESRGVLQLLRPGRFRLEYDTPDRQIYVADGKQLWLYDVELEQITVKPQDETLGTTPVTLLSGIDSIKQRYTITELGEHEGYTWIELLAHEGSSNIAHLRLALDGDQLRTMEMLDSFGQLTRLFFTTLKRNGAIAEQRFTFSPPPGVDVIGGVEPSGG